MPYITVGTENGHDIEIFYEDHGSGRPVVLIHGFPLNGRSWEREEAALIKAGFRVIAYGRRAFGLSSQPTTGYDYDTFVADLHALMEQLDLRDAVLVGHSMGTGEVTRYLARHGTERAARGVLISSLPPFMLKTDDNPEGLDAKVFEDIGASVDADRYAYLTSFYNDFYRVGLPTARPVSQDVLNANFQVAAAASGWAIRACVETWKTDFRPDVDAVRELGVPMLLIHGEDDVNTPIVNTGSRLPALWPQLRYEPVAGAAHGVAWSHAEVVNPLLIDFCGA